MATYQSVQSATVDNSGTLVITKPVSLAVGDVMLAGIYADRDGGSSASISTPAGWTQEILFSTTSGNGALGVYSKVADSSDVSASDFTFTGTGSTTQMHMIGHILRLTNYGFKEGETNAESGATSATLTMTGFTPTQAIADTLYVVFAARTFGSAVGISSVAMATSNPTWTERVESGVNGGTTDSQFAVYTATRTETTATGNFTITYGASDNTRSAGYAIAISPRVDGSYSAPDTKINAYAFTPIQSAVADAIVDEPTYDSMNMPTWTNPAKPTTTWTNLDK